MGHTIDDDDDGRDSSAMGWPKQEHTSALKDNVVTGGISCSEEVHIPEYSQWELK